MPHDTVRIGTRGSKLALVQAHLVLDALATAHPDRRFGIVTVKTTGDRDQTAPLRTIGGAGAFTAELEQTLLDGTVDVAVHSLKDLPTRPAPGLCLGAVPARDDTRDALVSHDGIKLQDLPAGAVVGTGSARRAACVLALRPDLVIQDIRGNVDTRIDKVRNGRYAATLLAYAGLLRLGMKRQAAEVFDTEVILPAPGQGAIGVECRDDPEWRELLEPIDDADLRPAARAERAFLDACAGGCHMPVGALARVHHGQVILTACITAPDGTRSYHGERTGAATEAATVGRELARELFDQGAAEIVDAIMKARSA